MGASRGGMAAPLSGGAAGAAGRWRQSPSRRGSGTGRGPGSGWGRWRWRFAGRAVRAGGSGTGEPRVRCTFLGFILEMPSGLQQPGWNWRPALRRRASPPGCKISQRDLKHIGLRNLKKYIYPFKTKKNHKTPLLHFIYCGFFFCFSPLPAGQSWRKRSLKRSAAAGASPGALELGSWGESRGGAPRALHVAPAYEVLSFFRCLPRGGRKEGTRNRLPTVSAARFAA